MRTLLTFLALALYCPAVFSGETLPLVTPGGTKLVVSKMEREEGIFAEFSGRIWVSGTLVAQWLRGVDEEADNTLDIRLLPDAASIKMLPYFESYPVKQIDLENETEVLKMAVESSVMTKLLHKEIKIVKAEGKFLLGNYIVGVDCNAPWARARVVKAKIPKPLNLTGTPDQVGC
ncbi:MAG: hypothetical protein AB1400_08995 [Pseudomonadota bacterium]